MGWQDRDYAREPSGGYGRPFGGAFSASHPRSIVTTLIVINVAIYVVASVSPLLRQYIYGLGALRAGAVLNGGVWQLITAQYLHAGIGHLLINMLVLHFLGRPLERMWSRRKFFAVYTIAGLCGNVFFVLLGSPLFQWIDADLPAVGASGCIYGLLGIVAVMFPTATVYLYFLFPIRIRTAALIFGGIAFLAVLTRGANFGGEACHLAGLAFGVWWAWRGDAWWSSGGRRVLDGVAQRILQARSRRRAGSGFSGDVEQRRVDADTIDRILRKVYDGGIHSLSDAEKLALREATDRQRERERMAGRVDRL